MSAPESGVPPIAEQRRELAATVDALSAKAHVTTRMKDAVAERRRKVDTRTAAGIVAGTGALVAVAIVYRRRRKQS